MTDINTFSPYRSGKFPTFSCSEKNCTYIGRNPLKKDIRQFQIDGEVFPSNSSPLRCDWLFLDDTDCNVYYVELKGSDVIHAIEQIRQTEQEIKSSIPQYAVHRRIIYHTKSQRVQSSTVLNWKRQGRGANVLKERKLEESF